MDVFLRLVINVLEEGLIYGIMAVGVYITYRVLHFPDLSWTARSRWARASPRR